MQDSEINKTARNIRDVIRYIKRFHNAIAIIYLDDEVLDSPLFSSHLRDISLIHQAGLKVVVVPGARKRIDQILDNSNIKWVFKDDVRITTEDAIPQIKMAAFDVSNMVMTGLASHQITATIGNWVRARAKGIIDGIDFGTAGEIDRLQIDAIKTTLESGFVPIFPCIGWSSTGKPYNISSISLAAKIAIELQADKLFFMIMDSEITFKNFSIPEKIGLAEDFHIPAMNLEELDDFLTINEKEENKTIEHSILTKRQKIIFLLKTARLACKNGVTRSHIINASTDGSLPCEIFSELGSGTMIYSSNYGGIRTMTQQDIPSVLAIMRPFVQSKILLPRTDLELLEKLSDYIVYEIDGGIRACSALHIYTDNQAEIAALAVDSAFSNLGIGPKMMDFLIKRAKSLGITKIFILTTQTADWFEKLHFVPASISDLPESRRSKWNKERNSKVYVLELQSK